MNSHPPLGKTPENNPLVELMAIEDYRPSLPEFKAIVAHEELQIKRYGSSVSCDEPLKLVVDICALLRLDAACLDDSRGGICKRTLAFLENKYPRVMRYAYGKLDQPLNQEK